VSLTLSRKLGERVRLKLGEQILWVAIGKKGATLQLSFEGSKEFQILREELVKDDKE
jgi:sRNA-binding carbon storage regulator CsrA